MASRLWRIRENGSALEIALHVQTRARRAEIVGIHNGALKIKVSAPPVDNAANSAVIEFCADQFDMPKSRIRIVSGAKSRDKILRIEGLSRADFQAKLPRIPI